MRIAILAGGSGTRLWPLSTDQRPKQFCQLTSEKTMLEETLDRFKDYPPEKKFIIITEPFLDLLKKTLPDFPEENIIIAPDRDTAPAMGLGALYLGQKDMEEPLVFVAADQKINQVDEFLNCIKEAEDVITETGKMLDIAIYPTKPNTALGYTKIGQRVFERNGVKFYEFLGHKEKPDFETAKKYIKSGKYLWHANYYMWTPRGFLEAYRRYAPEMYEVLMKVKEELEGGNNWEKIRDLQDQMEKISIDYAIAEKMDPKDVLIIKGEFGWRDIGSWDTLYEESLAEADQNKNVARGKTILVDTAGSMIYGDNKDKVIATIGVDDLVIVDTPEALLVCPKSRSQEVKKVIAELKKGSSDKDSDNQ